MTHDIASLEGSARIVVCLCIAVVGGLAAMVGAIFVVAWEASIFGPLSPPWLAALSVRALGC